MSQVETSRERLQRIKVIGVGGGGSNAVRRMIEAGIEGVEFVTINTSLREMVASRASARLQIGAEITHGLSTGGDVSLGVRSAEAAQAEIAKLLENTDMVFIAATLGGGTGTGAAPVVARLAKERGILTVAVVTKPFGFEGARRSQAAEEGLRELVQHVDAEIVISNDRLLSLDVRNLKLTDAFSMADEMLKKAVQIVCDFVLKVGLINVDLRDVIAILTNGGRTMVSMTRATGEERALAAAQEAITSPLLDITLQGATGLLLNIEGGDLSIGEVHAAADLISRTASPDANIIWGYVDNPELKGEIRITLIATGYQVEDRSEAQPRRGWDMPTDLDRRPSDSLDLDIPTRLRR
jgi:cell division protein FtsZ